MLALTHHFDEPVRSGSTTYLARVYGGATDGGAWGGWIVFFPIGGGPVISTDRETTQASMPALSTWAGTLTHADLQLALERALALRPDAELQRELDRLALVELDEAVADARADTLEAAAAAARARARAVETEREIVEDRVLASASETAAREAAAHEIAAEASRRTAAVADRALRAKKTAAKKK